MAYNLFLCELYGPNIKIINEITTDHLAEFSLPIFTRLYNKNT